MTVKKSSLGMDANIAGLLCYVLGWVSGIILFVVENNSKFVKFHGLQSLLVFGALTVLRFIFFFVPFLISIIWLAWVIIAVILMLKAYQGEYYRFPLFGDIADRYAR